MARTPLIALLACLAAVAAVAGAPASASASSRQEMTFEAPRELADGLRRGTPTLDELSGLGVHALRVIVYWQQIAPSPDARRKPAFDAADPGAYPAAAWAPLDAIVAGARARGMRIQLTVSGPSPLGDPRRARTT